MVFSRKQFQSKINLLPQWEIHRASIWSQIDSLNAVSKSQQTEEWHHQNGSRSFLPASPAKTNKQIPKTKTTDFHNHPWTRVHLWKSWSPAEKSVTMLEQKHLRLDALKGLSVAVSLYLCHTSTKWHSSVSRENFLTHDFAHRKKVRACEWGTSFLTCDRHCQKDPFISWPNQKTEVCFTTEGQEVALGAHQRDMYPINHFTDFIKRYAHALLGIPNLQRPQNGPWAPPIFHMPQPHTPLPHG